jgi:hypothetical protein
LKNSFFIIWVLFGLIACNNPDTGKAKGIIDIEIIETLSNPEAYNLLKTIEAEFGLKNADTTQKSINILDNNKFYPLSSRLYEYHKLSHYYGDTVFVKEGTCGFFAYGIFENANIKFADSILRSSEKVLGKYDCLWTPIVRDEVFFLSILTRNKLKINAVDISEILVEDYSSKKLLSYPLQNYDRMQEGKKVISIKWNNSTQQRIDSLYGGGKAIVCLVTINNQTYIAGELDTLNIGVTIRDIKETLLDSLDIYFPRK